MSDASSIYKTLRYFGGPEDGKSMSVPEGADSMTFPTGPNGNFSATYERRMFRVKTPTASYEEEVMAYSMLSDLELVDRIQPPGGGSNTAAFRFPRPVPVFIRNSSAVSGVAYCSETQTLDVAFKAVLAASKNGEPPVTVKPARVYRYQGVPASVFTAFLGSESIGRFYNTDIKNRFPSVLL